jgi:hypothetical protein
MRFREPMKTEAVIAEDSQRGAHVLQAPIPSPECANLVVWFESVAQLVEHRPFKALVLGSSPSALTINSITYRQFQSGPENLGYKRDTPF